MCKLGITLPDGVVIMGIDPSLTATGLALLKGSDLVTITASPPMPTKTCPRGDFCRLAWFKERIGAVLRTGNPLVVAIEGYAYGAKSQAHSLGELGGVIRVLLFESVIPNAVVVPPNVLKKFATGTGNADKGAVSKGLFKRWGVDVENNNEADASGLALLGAALHFPDVFSLKSEVHEAISRACERLPVKSPA